MIKKTYIAIMIFIGFIITSTAPSALADDTLTVTDSADDVEQYDALTAELIGTYPVPNIDITEVKAEKTDDSVTVTLTIDEEGQIEKLDSSYGIFLFTTSPSLLYIILYTGIEEMGIGEEYGFGSDGFLVTHGYEELVDITSSSVEDNVMTLSFKLESSDERIIGLYATTSKEPGGNYSYADEAPDGVEDEMMSLTPNAGGTYNATAGKPVNFQATVEEGDPGDYEWVWVIEETGTTLTGATPSNTFKIPDTYSGLVYVFDGQGKWGYDEFSVEVAENPADNGDNNGSPGFEMIILLGAIVAVLVAVISLKRK